MTTILFIWMMVATPSNSSYAHWNWVNSGEFRTAARCEAAIKQLSLDSTKARCIEK